MSYGALREKSDVYIRARLQASKKFPRISTQTNKISVLPIIDAFSHFPISQSILLFGYTHIYYARLFIISRSFIYYASIAEELSDDADLTFV